MDLYHDEDTWFKLSRQQKVAEVAQKAYRKQVWLHDGLSNVKQEIRPGDEANAIHTPAVFFEVRVHLGI